MRGTIVGISAVLFLALLAGSFVNGTNEAMASEKAIQAAWKQEQIIRDEGYQTVTGLIGADKLAWEQYQAIFNGAIEGRYGDSGAEAVLLAIQESTPNPPVQLREQVMNAMRDAASRFANSQTALADHQRAYDTYINTFPANLYLSALGYPKTISGELAPPSDIDGDGRLTVLDYPVLMSSHTREEFKTATVEPFSY